MKPKKRNQSWHDKMKTIWVTEDNRDRLNAMRRHGMMSMDAVIEFLLQEHENK